MSNRENWKPLRLTVPSHHTDIQKQLGMTSAMWRQAQIFDDNADQYAKVLIDKVTPELVLERLAAFDPATAATIIRLFGNDLSDRVVRARLFEVCDFVYFEGDEDRIAEHRSIWQSECAW